MMVNDCGDDNATDDDDDGDNDNYDNVKQDFIALFFRISNHFGSFCCCYKCVNKRQYGQQHA